MSRDPRRATARPCRRCPSWPPGCLTGIATYHKHYSSMMERSLSSNDAFNCAPCKMYHSPEVVGRLRVCVTASYLHEFWLPRDPRIRVDGNPFHVDYLSVPGAGILDLADLFKTEYGSVFSPIDVVLVGYLSLFSCFLTC